MMEEVRKVIKDYQREQFTLKEWVKYGILAP